MNQREIYGLITQVISLSLFKKSKHPIKFLFHLLVLPQTLLKMMTWDRLCLQREQGVMEVVVQHRLDPLLSSFQDIVAAVTMEIPSGNEMDMAAYNKKKCTTLPR